jgi:hypothetical protein
MTTRTGDGFRWGAPGGVLLVIVCWDASRLGWPSRWWAAAATVAVAVAVAGSLRTVRSQLAHPALVPLVLGGSAVAVYAAVPETDQMRRVAVVLATLGVFELATRKMLPLPWHAAAAAIVLWSGIYGATGRQSALVAAVFALWPVPLVRLLCRWRAAPAPPPTAIMVAGIGIVAAVVVSRTGGIATTALPAVVAVGVAASVSTAAALALQRWSTRPVR